MFLLEGGGGGLFDLEVTSHSRTCVIDAAVKPDVLRCAASVGIKQSSTCLGCKTDTQLYCRISIKVSIMIN